MYGPWTTLELRKHFDDSLLWCCPNSRCFHPKGWHFVSTRKMHASQSLEDMRNLTLGKICQTCAAWSISPLILCPWLHFHPCSRGEKPYFKLKAIEKETPSVRRWRCLDFGKFRKCLTFWLYQSSFGKTPFIQTAGFSSEFATIQVKLCWKERLRVAPVFPPRETSLPDAHCYTLAHYTSLLLRKKNPEKPWPPWLRHASAPLAPGLEMHGEPVEGSVILIF